MPTATTVLDREEYLHLSLEAVRQGDHGAALAYLKDGAEKYPQDARLAYMLGAEYAQIALYDRAEAEMARAIQIDPSLHTACFQLGLLQLTCVRVQQAEKTWQGLNSLPETHAFRLFRQGLLALAAERFEEARQQIQAGLIANDFSIELNRDMENLLARFPATATQTTAEPGGQNNHLWLHNYQTSDQHNH